MKAKFKNTLVIASIVMIGLGTYKTYGSYVSSSNSKESLLLAENIEALSAGDTQNYSGYAKDYETGEGMYITEIKGTASGNLQLNMRISTSLLAQLSGSVTAVAKPEWKMTCQANMGCYTSCSSENEWRMGKKEDILVRGC